MKTKLFLAAMVFAANCTIANAQVLGGNAVGGLGGSLGVGGARDIGAVGHGTANGAFGADLDTGSLRRQSGEMADRTSTRARSTLNATRDHARTTTRDVARVGRGAVGVAHDQAISGAAKVTSTAASGTRAAFATGHDAMATASTVRPSIDVDGATASDAALGATKSEGDALELPSASMSGEAERSGNAEIANAPAPLDIGGDASAGGSASASKDGAQARGSANGAGEIGIGK